MATKNNPGKFDCYANAGPDEQTFTLLGRDRHGGGTVRVWALIRHRAGEAAEVIAEALECAKAMDEQAVALGKAPNIAALGEPFTKLYLALTEGMDEHPEGFDWPCQCNLCLSYGDS